MQTYRNTKLTIMSMLEFCLNGSDFSLNSVNSENLIAFSLNGDAVCWFYRIMRKKIQQQKITSIRVGTRVPLPF